MTSVNKNTQPLLQNSYYHIYNRGNNHERIFYSEKNYRYFLRKYDEFLSDHLDTLSYCLIPNHFHFVIKTKSEGEVISEQFRKLFITYSQAFNKQQRRSGSLFLKPFRRKLISDNNYLLRAIFYVHCNPVHHRICKEIEHYKWSSYNTILSDSKTKLKRDDVIQLFGDRERFIQFHKDMLNTTDAKSDITDAIPPDVN